MNVICTIGNFSATLSIHFILHSLKWLIQEGVYIISRILLSHYVSSLIEQEAENSFKTSLFSVIERANSFCAQTSSREEFRLKLG